MNGLAEVARSKLRRGLTVLEVAEHTGLSVADVQLMADAEEGPRADPATEEADPFRQVAARAQIEGIAEVNEPAPTPDRGAEARAMQEGLEARGAGRPGKAAVRRDEGEDMEQFRERRNRAAAGLVRGFAAPADDRLAEKVKALGDELEKLHRTVASVAKGCTEGWAEIEAKVLKLESSVADVREVSLEGRAGVMRFGARDTLAVALAMFVSFRTGGTVDIPLSDGTVIEGLRAGELAEIARQLLEG